MIWFRGVSLSLVLHFLRSTHMSFSLSELNRQIALLLGEERKRVNNPQKLSDIVGAVFEWAYVKYFGAVGNINSTIFHSSGIAAAGCIDGYAFRNDFGRRG